MKPTRRVFKHFVIFWATAVLISSASYRRGAAAQSRNNSTEAFLARKSRRRPLPLRGCRSFTRLTLKLGPEPLMPSARASLFVERWPASSVLQAASYAQTQYVFDRLAAV